jgi:hypothetical protein
MNPQALPTWNLKTWDGLDVLRKQGSIAKYLDNIGINVGTKQGNGAGGANGWAETSAARKLRARPRKVRTALSVVETLVEVTLCQQPRS